MSAYKVGLIGCGQMGSAIIKGIFFKKPELVRQWYICDVNDYKMQALEDAYKVKKATIKEICENAEMILLAVKPAHIDSVLEELAKGINKRQFVVSIAAGIKLKHMEDILPYGSAVIRVMPNMPTMIGEGMAVLSPGKNSERKLVEYVETFFNTMGKSLILPESYMDAVTAVSGSGPAYVFLMIEAFIEAAVAEGITLQDAKTLVLQTIKGSIALMEQTQEDATLLKQRICSPGGTTIAAVRALESNGIRKGFFDAVSAAVERSCNLG